MYIEFQGAVKMCSPWQIFMTSGRNEGFVIQIISDVKRCLLGVQNVGNVFEQISEETHEARMTPFCVFIVGPVNPLTSKS